eukprot:GCRY01005782.1.p1 GENE.GCRY01005782.1~~GCRY01005782.1.p1  ORF type:complete len:123 (+),score=10.93 GCRY01005782.1:479-847(+)
MLFGNEKRTVYVQRRASEENSDNCVCQTVKHGGGKIMVWGCFSREGLGNTERVDHRLDSDTNIDLCRTNMKASFHKIFGSSVLRGKLFQQDNAPRYTSKKTMDWLKAQRILVLNWPAQSPDL